MCSLGTIIFFAVVAAENLLQNPSFESLDASKHPEYWDSYVMPQEGSFARVDAMHACDGKNSVKITNKSQYTTEPCNNWSQNVLDNLAGKTLDIKGSIKTDKATSAAIWVQCWHKDPLSVTKVETTRAVSGTSDWTPVEAKVMVPKGTDFVVVRCILKGIGTAWFDDVSLSEAGSGKKEGTKEPAVKKAAKEKPDPDLEKPDHDSETAEEKPATKPDVRKASSEMDEDQAKTLDDLKKTVRSLRDSNKDLNEQVAKMKVELRMLRDQVETDKIQPPPPLPAPIVSEKPKVAVPPLVPHGMNWQETR